MNEQIQNEQTHVIELNLPEGIFQATNNPNVFIDNYGQLFSLEMSRSQHEHYLKQLTAFPSRD